MNKTQTRTIKSPPKPRPVSMMTDQEKNEVLAEWVGFKSCQDRCVPLPNLYHSLDAQVKWLWPKLIERQLLLRVLQQLIINPLSLTKPAKVCAEMILELIESEAKVEV